MTRLLTTIGAATLTLGLAAAGLGAATASAADPSTPTGFSAVRSLTGFTAQSIASPSAGRLIVAGVDADKHIVVEDQKDGVVTLRQVLPATADDARIVASGDNIWLLGTGATPSLWRWQSGAMTQVPMPAAPKPGTWVPTTIAVEGNLVVVMAANGSSSVAATFDGSLWSYSVAGPDAGWSTKGPSASRIVMITHGSVLADTDLLGFYPGGELLDYSAQPPRTVLTTYSYRSHGDYQARVTALTADAPDDGVSCGRITTRTYPDPTQRTSYYCSRWGSHATNLPAPSGEVRLATSLGDGRTVIAGAGGLAVYAKDNTLQALQSTGAVTRALSVEPGSAIVWALNGTVLERADLSHGQTPTPTATGTPTPTDTATPVPTDTATPTPTDTDCPPAPTPTKTKKPKKPKKPWHPHF